MARHSCSFIVSVDIDNLPSLIITSLQDCELDVQYQEADYIMAREIPGGVSFSKLVTVEALIDQSTSTETEARFSLVVKNEEQQLPLENHCHQTFEFIKQEIEQSRHWHLIETLAG